MRSHEDRYSSFVLFETLYAEGQWFLSFYVHISKKSTLLQIHCFVMNTKTYTGYSLRRCVLEAMDQGLISAEVVYKHLDIMDLVTFLSLLHCFYYVHCLSLVCYHNTK